MNDARQPTRLNSPWVAAAVMASVFWLAAVPLIVSGRVVGRAGEDQVNYHEPTIRQFAAELPRPNLHDYLSATTPGYHLVLGAAARAGIDSTTGLRLVGSLFTAGLVALLAWACAARTGVWAGIVLTLPVACSMYVFMPGVWLLPDCAGWLGVLVVLLLALWGKFDAPAVVGGGMLMAALVMVRQIHLWAAAALWAGAWLSAAPMRDRARDLFSAVPQRLRRTAVMVAATLPAFVVLALFVRMWGGLTPPRFHQQYRGMNPAAPAFVLSLIGGFGVFYAGFVLDGVRSAWLGARWMLVGAAAAGLLAALVPETTLSVEEGRFSGLWNVAGKLPVIAGRTSPLLLALSALGAATLLVWGRMLPARERWIFLAALGAFTAAQMASHEIFQRYAEPMVLMVLALMASRIAGTARGQGEAAPARAAPARLAGAAVLAGLLAAITAYKIATAGPARVNDTLPGRSGSVQNTPG